MLLSSQQHAYPHGRQTMLHQSPPLLALEDYEPRGSLEGRVDDRGDSDADACNPLRALFAGGRGEVGSRNWDARDLSFDGGGPS